MTFRVELSPTAARQLRRLDRPVAARIVALLDLLATNPRPPKATPLVGRPGVLRVRTGDYRVLYEVHDEAVVVLVVAIGHRGSIYRDRMRDCLISAG